MLVLPAFKDRLCNLEEPILSIPLRVLRRQFQVVSESKNELQLHGLLALADLVELICQVALVVYLEATEVILVNFVVNLDYFDDILVLQNAFVC